MTFIHNILHKFTILLFAIAGQCLICYLRLRRFKLTQYGTHTGARNHPRIIISLTSYGRRVSDVVPYTIHSLLRQTYKPDMVILWLDRDNWSDHTLPTTLKQLQQQGLTVRYCEDLKSYKKHIPALTQYPNDLIITTDDDFYYSSHMVEHLIHAYLHDPNRIYTLRAHRPLFSTDNQLLPYNDWQMLITDTSLSPIFPTTGGGCLFQLRLLHPDTTRAELFTRLCPKADDVWFYFMGLMAHTPITVLPSWITMMIPLDIFYQKFHRGASLQDDNRKQSLNDTQIQQVMNHYHLSTNDLRQSL